MKNSYWVNQKIMVEMEISDDDRDYGVSEMTIVSLVELTLLHDIDMSVLIYASCSNPYFESMIPLPGWIHMA